ncbi:MAG: (d)CMP kinase, partial [Candidatus Korobacteraceae bacterium]
SRVSAHPSVRRVLVARQRELGASGGVVMEGRDIGTAVFPNADVKIFLDADPTVRAERRVLQNGDPSADERQRVQAEIAARDERDRTRVASPLVPAPDAVILDTTHKSIDEVVAELEAIVRKRLDRGA